MERWEQYVNANARPTVEREPLLQELAVGLSDLFTLTWAHVQGRAGAQYLMALLRPNARAKTTLMTEREIACVIAPYSDIEVRAIDALEALVERHRSRVDPRIVLLVHSDPAGNEKLIGWGEERGLSMLPLERSSRDGMPDRDELVRSLSDYLYRQDTFALTEPVARDRDFFGRRNDAEALLRSLVSGKVRSMFAIRRAGKTSVVNRVRNLIEQSEEASIAMIDASAEALHSLDANQFQQAVAATAARATEQQYAVAATVVQEGIGRSTPLLAELSKQREKPLILVFDEVDYIGPRSPSNPSWARHFVPFWRALRVAYQGSRRQERPVGILVCGVSSLSFREGRIGDQENPVFGFVPEEYLEPFAREPAVRMIRDLGLRCGLRFDANAAERLHEVCHGFPFWLRLAGSMIHQALPVSGRPLTVSAEDIKPLVRAFIEDEGTEAVQKALENLGDHDPEVLTAAREVAAGRLPQGRLARLAMRYGLVQQDARGGYHVPDGLIRAALLRTEPPIRRVVEPQGELVTSEIAVLHNRVERDMRTLIRGVLQAAYSNSAEWTQRILSAVPEERRAGLTGRRGAELLGQLYFLELKQIVLKEWPLFQGRFGDRQRFVQAMDIANDRPFAHAKDHDVADLALFRREYRWLQERVDA
jgi:hypothetical protein